MRRAGKSNLPRYSGEHVELLPRRNILQENLDDEHGNGNPDDAHFVHYLQLLDNIGISREIFEQYHEMDGIRFALSLAKSVSRSGNIAFAVGYMLVNEGMTQITYSAAKSALLTYHPHMDTHFFDLHIEVDDHHVAELYRAVRELGPENIDPVFQGVSIGERGMAVLLDEAYGTLL